MSDEELIARLRKADEYEPLGHDGWEAADRIEALVKADRAQVEVAEKQAETIIRINARAERLESALRLIEATTTPPVPIPWTHSVAADTYWQMIDRMKFTARAALKGADHD